MVLRRTIMCILIISLVFFTLLLLCESILRIIGFSYDTPFYKKDIFIQRKVNEGARIYTFSLDRFWKYKPLSENVDWGITINSLGFNDKEYDLSKPVDFRLFVVGASADAGHKVNIQARYSNLLEDFLKKQYPSLHIQVINASVPGYSSLQEMRYAIEIMNEYNPSCIIVSSGLNDRKKARYEDKEITPRRIITIMTVKALARILRTVQLIQKYFGSNYPPAWKTRVSGPDYVANLSMIKQIARSKGTDILFLRSYFRDECAADNANSGYPSQLPVIDIRNVLNARDTKLSDLFITKQHWSETGHSIIAESIMDWIIQNNIVQKGMMDNTKE